MIRGLDTFQEMKKWMEIAKTEGEKFYDGNASAGTRARKAFDMLANLKIQWRKECLAK